MGPFLTCIMGIVFLTVYLYLVLYRLDHPAVLRAKVIFAGIVLIFLRMCVPVNFPFTYTIYSRKLLLPLADIFFKPVGTSGRMISDILMLCWLTVAAVRSGRLLIRTIRLRRYLNAYTVKEEAPYLSLFASVRKYCKKPVRIAVVPHDVSPGITQIIRPTIVFPESYICFSGKELDYICMHEINHYRHHDLWMKWLLELLSCIHWWNPLVYLLKKEYALTLELANDHRLMREYPDYNSIDYADLILKIAEGKSTPAPKDFGGLTAFVRKRRSDLNVRLSFILKEPEKKEKSGKYLWVHGMVICAVMLFSLFVVVEPDSWSSPIGEDGTFELQPEYAYFVHTAEGYEIYVEGQYMGTTYELPEDFEHFKIYEKGEQPNE